MYLKIQHKNTASQNIIDSVLFSCDVPKESIIYLISKLLQEPQSPVIIARQTKIITKRL